MTRKIFPQLSYSKSSFLFTAAILIVVLYLFNCFNIFHYIVDDSFTLLCPVRTFVDTGYFSAQPGERHFGMHDPLLVLCLCAVYRLCHDSMLLPYAMKVFLMLCGIITLLIPLITYRSEKLGIVSKTGYLIFLASSTPFIVWTVGGMSAVFAGMMLLINFILYDKAIENRNFYKYFLVQSVAVFYSRMDLAIILVPLIIFFVYNDILGQIVKDISWKKQTFRFLSAAFKNRSFYETVLFWCLPLIIFQGWLYIYFENLIPYTSDRLAGMSCYKMAWGGVHFLEFAALNMNFIPVLLILWFLSSRGKAGRSASEYCFSASLYLLYIISTGEIHMMNVYRQYVPLLPVLYLLAAFAFERITQIYKHKLSLMAKYASAVLLITLGVNEYINLYHIKNVSIRLSFITKFDPNDKTVNDNYTSIETMKLLALKLKETLHREEVVLISDYLSLIPYYSGLYTFDATGIHLNSEKTSSRLIGGKCCKGSHKECLRNKKALRISNSLVKTSRMENARDMISQEKGIDIFYFPQIMRSSDSGWKKYNSIYDGSGYLVWFTYVDISYIGSFCMEGLENVEQTNSTLAKQ